MSEVQSSNNQQLATQPESSLVSAGSTVSSVKTVKTTKKTTSSSKKSSATKKVTTITTGTDGEPVSNTTSESVKEEQKSATSTATTATKSISTAPSGEVKTESASTTSAVMSASKSVIIQKSGQTYSQHMASICSGTSEEQLGLDLNSLKAALANSSPSFQIQELVREAPDQTVILLKPEDLVDQKDGGKAALLSFNVSEFESQSLEVTTDGNKVQVHAKKKSVNPEGEERSEEFSRVYELPSPEPIDPAHITTSVFQDGVLTIELPVGSNVIVVVEKDGEEAKEK